MNVDYEIPKVDCCSKTTAEKYFMAHFCPFSFHLFSDTVVHVILNIQTDMFGQTVQTKIRLLREQSDQGLHCFHFTCIF